jgi:hypothetical protein
MTPELFEALEDYATRPLGCSNHGCRISPPVGQGTCGPCHCCHPRQIKWAQDTIGDLIAEVRRLQQLVKELREAK